MLGPSWAYWIVGALLGTGALLLMFPTRLHDRARGRRRCPRCWYGMEGVPGLVCPECGHVARRESRLGKTRRRRRLVAIGVLVAIASAGVLLAPRVQRHGWWSLVPTTVLLLAAPDAGQEYAFGAQGGRLVPLAAELARRDAAPGLADWQWGLYFERKGFVDTREAWPAGRPIVFRASRVAWAGGLGQTITGYGCTLVGDETQATHAALAERRAALTAFDPGLFMTPGIEAPGAHQLPMHLAITRAYNLPERRRLGPVVPIRIVTDASEAIRPVRAVAIDELIATLLLVRFYAHEGLDGTLSAGGAISIRAQTDPSLKPLAFGMRIDLLHAGETIGSARVSSIGTPETWGEARVYAVFRIRVERDPGSPAPLEEMTLRIRGDADESVDDLRYDAYWAGEVSLPLADFEPAETIGRVTRLGWRGEARSGGIDWPVEKEEE